MLSTSQARAEWGPKCFPANELVRLSLHGAGKVSVRPEIVDAVRALNVCLVHWGYRTRAADTGAYNCRTITGGTGVSLHGLGIAIDINWADNPYGSTLITDMPTAMTDAIKAIRTRSGARVWGWGGDYRTSKDAMHFEAMVTRAHLASGIDTSTLPQHTTPPTEEPEMNTEERKMLTDALAQAREANMRSARAVALLEGKGYDPANPGADNPARGSLLARVLNGIYRADRAREQG